MKALKISTALALAALVGGGIVMMMDQRAVTESADPDASAKGLAAIEEMTRKGAYKDDFAALNARREDVVTLPSGVQYEILQPGSGARPQPGGVVLMYYTGSLSDGRVFDSTANSDGPLSVELDAIAVPGLREALLLMPEGSRWRVVVPPSEGFSRSGNNRLRRRDLIYNIELVAVDS